MDEYGVCIFAYNNKFIDYIKLAHIAAGYIKKNMKHNKTCLVTDGSSYEWMQTIFESDHILTEDIHKRCFDHVVVENVEFKQNPRRHYDSPWSTFSAQFSNSNKDDIFKLTPFEKTLLVDSDYIIQNNFYDYIFETDIPVSIHRDALYLEKNAPYLSEKELNEAGIHHWWSTVVYFDQSEESKIFFDIWSHVKENWDYYRLLYQFPRGLYRTDFCVSVAAHIMNGFNDENFVHDFNGIAMINSDQKDDIANINSVNDWVFFANDREERWKNILVRRQNANTHIMNKMALGRHSDTIMEYLIGELYGVE